MAAKRLSMRKVREILRLVTSAGCAPQKVHPALIARFRLATVGCFWPIFFFADHNEAWHTLAGVCIPSLNASLALPV